MLTIPFVTALANVGFAMPRSAHTPNSPQSSSPLKIRMRNPPPSPSTTSLGFTDLSLRLNRQDDEPKSAARRQNISTVERKHRKTLYRSQRRKRRSCAEGDAILATGELSNGREWGQIWTCKF